MDHPLIPDPGGITKYLDRTEVHRATVAQLTKDLGLADHVLKQDAASPEILEDLIAQVLPILEHLLEHNAHAFQVAMYRVDIPEAHLHRLMASGGVKDLAGGIVLRCLQKVLTRLRFAGLGK